MTIYDNSTILLGHNLFLSTECGSPMSIISDASFGSSFYLSYKSNNRIYRDFSLSVNIFIKEVRLYTFEKKKSVYQDQEHHFHVKKRHLQRTAEILYKGKDFYV